MDLFPVASSCWWSCEQRCWVWIEVEQRRTLLWEESDPLVLGSLPAVRFGGWVPFLPRLYGLRTSVHTADCPYCLVKLHHATGQHT